MKNTMLVFLFSIVCSRSFSQNITAGFTAPDTVCVNSPVNIQNISQGATNYFWNFCAANINQPPTGTNLGNVGGTLSLPVYIDYVFTNGKYYGFVTNNSPGGLLRLDFGNSLLNIPTVMNLGNLGGAVPNNTEGIQIANDNGKWYVLIAGGETISGSLPSLTTVSLGANITNNTPTATNWGNLGNLAYPHDLYVFNDTGHWYGLTVNYSNNTVTLFDLTTNLSNKPSGKNLGNVGNLSGPTGIQAINDNGNWRVFVTNATSSTLTRLDFGSALTNTPTGVNLGNPNNAFVTCWDIYIIKYCGESEAFVINANGSYDIVKLDFGSSLLNTPTAVSLGNQGNLNFPHCISKLFRVGPDVFSFITNVNNNTLTLLDFKGCTNSNVPNSTAKNPPPPTYDKPGIYNINLTVDDGLPTQTSFCKQVVVQDCVVTTCNNWLLTPSTPSYVQVGQLNIPGNKITVEATINRTSPYSGGALYAGDIVSKHDNPSDVNYLLRPNEAEITTSNGYFRTPDVCEIELNKTYHVAMVYDGSVLKFYRNGFLMSQIAATGNLYQNSWNTIIGYYQHQLVNTNFIGYINEVRIWNVARTQPEIRAYMNTSLPNPITQPGLLAYYTFNSLINKQGNPSWDGTLAGNASINQTNTSCSFIADSCTTPVNVSSIINDYTEVLDFDICKNELTVTDATKYNPGDTVLLIQMKGATIDSSNTASFGTVTNYKNAGNYEFNIIKQKTGNMLTLLNGLLRQYNIPNGKVQLVRVPYYNTADITQTLTCLPWDGSKGGVLVLNAKNTISLSADIDVSGKGFIGGKSLNPHSSVLYCNYDEFYYPINTPGAAEKGESITEISSAIKWGKGSPANGGGGGNGHNSGGGGGSNGGQGGFGGYQLDACGGSATDNRGIGGKNLLYNNGSDKIFLGGGGGSGQTDNMGGSDMNGANGGGIIIIKSPVFNNNGFKIIAKGGDVPNCNLSPAITCHDGNGGGGGAGTVLIESNNVTSTTNIDVSGGKGGDVIFYDVVLGSRIGPGGGGGAGVVWLNTPSLPSNIIVNKNGGINGVIIPDNNNPYGTTPGQPGKNLFNLKIPVDTILFKSNIDSVAFTSTASSCTSFSFKGQGYTNKVGITKWQWSFGDGVTATSQNTSHTYGAMGTYTVKLIVTDVNGCIDSVANNVSTNTASFDFSYTQDVCDPFAVQFFNVGAVPVNPVWSFGDGGASNAANPVHTFASPGNYLVKFSVQNGGCIDTVSKTISVGVIPANIILTPDTTICIGSTKQLRTVPSLSFCWTPTTYLDDPLSANPVTSAPKNIMYYFTAEVTGNNIINNGDFSNGNTGFTSQYNFANNNTIEGEYFVGKSPQAWNASLSNCGDHTSGNGNMMLVNGAPIPDVNVWTQTVMVTPNTNYAFSTWIQALYPPNPAQMQFSINGRDIGSLITASLPTCTWTQFYTTWNSGNNATATISIVNKNTQIQGNDFALDDISFAPVSIQKDSVQINVNTPFIKASNDTAVCAGTKVQLATSGASSYRWTPAAGLSNAAIANPVATIGSSTSYYVTGTNSFGCQASDTVNISALALPVITKSRDTTICTNNSVQIFATGGIKYAWSPVATLSNPNISNPVASPLSSIKYFVTVTNGNTCTNTDSVLVSIQSLPVFTISPDASVCLGITKQLQASGGDTYTWSPATGLDNVNISNPVATPLSSTTYTVIIHENACNQTGTLSTTLTALALPNVQASSANDITCSLGSSQLNVTGGLNYIWTPAATLNNANIPNPVAKPLNTTIYTVSGKDINGCSNTDTVIVKADFAMKALYLMPNSFTPNGDGINDCFGLKNWGTVQELDFSIYNRYGERVFHTTDAGNCWNGKYKQQLQDANVFVYIIRAKTVCGLIDRKGIVTLIK